MLIKPADRLKFKFTIPNYGTYSTSYTYKKALKTEIFSKTKPAVVCIHGFGGNADQFRYNVPVLSKAGYDTYALDLLGYGYSQKPNPKQYGVNELYNFDNWSNQTSKFIQEVVRKPVVLVCNSVGGVVGLQLAKERPDLVKEIIVIDVSLRLLHVKKQNPLQKVVVPIIQQVLRETDIGKFFFNSVAKKETIRNILNSAYAYPMKTTRGVDDETVSLILQPGLDEAAVNVFLDFISYSGGPLPEELLAQLKTPVTILWGEHDPWEPLDLAKKSFADFPCVHDFIVLPDGGHCPMDQIPDTVNREILKVLSRQR